MKIILMAKMKNTPLFQDATAIIMNYHHKAVIGTKHSGKDPKTHSWYLSNACLQRHFCCSSKPRECQVKVN